MFKKRVVVASLLVLIAVLSVATGCDMGVRVGELQTRSQVVELDGADTVNVEIQAGAVDLDVSGGASELLEASFSYNVEALNPRATYAGGRLEVMESDVDEGIGSILDLDEYRNEWDLKLNEDVPMAMTVNLGAGPANLALGALSLSRLSINGGAGNVDLDLNSSPSLSQLDFNMGAGEVTIDLSGEWQNDLDASIEGGLGTLNVTLPSNVGVAVDVETGVGGVDAHGLTRVGDTDTYTNEAYGKSDVTLRIEINGGAGSITLDAE